MENKVKCANVSSLNHMNKRKLKAYWRLTFTALFVGRASMEYKNESKNVHAQG